MVQITLQDYSIKTFSTATSYVKAPLHGSICPIYEVKCGLKKVNTDMNVTSVAVLYVSARIHFVIRKSLGQFRENFNPVKT